MVVRGTTHLRELFGIADGHLVIHLATLTVVLWGRGEGWHLYASNALRLCEAHFRRALTALTLRCASLLVGLHVHWAGASSNAVFIRAHDWQRRVLTLVTLHLCLWILETTVYIVGTSTHWIGLTAVSASHHVKDFREPLSVLGDSLVGLSEG